MKVLRTDDTKCNFVQFDIDGLILIYVEYSQLSEVDNIVKTACFLFIYFKTEDLMMPLCFFFFFCKICFVIKVNYRLLFIYIIMDMTPFTY